MHSQAIMWLDNHAYTLYSENHMHLRSYYGDAASQLFCIFLMSL